MKPCFVSVTRIRLLQKCWRIYVVCMVISWLSCSEILYEEDISEAIVVLIAPVDEAVLKAPDLLLSWAPVEGAVQYHLQIAQPSFENPLQIVQDTVITKNNFSVMLPVNDYAWRVKALNSTYETKFSTQIFHIEE